MPDLDPAEEALLAPLRDAPWLRPSDMTSWDLGVRMRACDEREYVYLRRCREALKDLVNAAAATPHFRGPIELDDAERALDGLPRRRAGRQLR